MMLKKSITDYALDSDDALLRDLIVDELNVAAHSWEQEASAAEAPSESEAPESAANLASSLEEIGWILSNCDEDSTEASTSQEEFDRLQVLKMYSSMGINNNDATLDELTSMASKVFQHDYTWILLMDLRISWIVSSQGLGGMSECPRHLYFPCAHALRTKQPALMVENMMDDPRFDKSPFANGPLGARFYAAAPLISPQGFRIGVFGVASREARSMSLQQQEILKGFADLTMRHLVERRKKFDLEEKLKKAVACTSHDIMTPLMGLQLSLASLKDDKELDVSLSVSQRELLSTADSCVSTMCQLGKTAMQTVHEGLNEPDASDCFVLEKASSVAAPCQLAELVDRLHQTLDPIDKLVPLMISVDPDTPSTVTIADLPIFRAAVSLLCLACSRTTSGFIKFRIYMEDDQIVFACESSAPALSHGETASFTDPSANGKSTLPCLRLVANAIRPLGGTCGCASSWPVHSTTFWFTVSHAGAATANNELGVALPVELRTGSDSPTAVVDPSNFLPRSAQTVAKRGLFDAIPYVLACDDLPRKKKVLVIDDSLVVRKSLQRALSTKFGYEVTVAEDGREGLARLQETIFDFVLMDYMMPVLDGWDCTQQYRKWEAHHRPWYRQHIIGMSAHAGDKDVHRASQFGMDDYRCKPVTIKTLTDLNESFRLRQIQKQLDYLLPLFSRDPADASESPLKKMKGAMLCLSSEFTSRSHGFQAPISENTMPVKHLSAGKQVCLVCRSPAPESPWNTISTADSFRQRGWDAEVVQSSDEALSRLKQRNYGAVIVEEGFAPLSGTAFVSKFRMWESENRVNRQNHMILQLPAESELSNMMSHRGPAIIQPPAGFDYVICADSAWNDFHCLVGDCLATSSSANVNGIVLR